MCVVVRLAVRCGSDEPNPSTKQVANATRDSVEQQGEQVKAIAEETERIGTNLEAADVHVRCVLWRLG